jgi:ribulose-5-phosphate 4-epimerase/fuculose-1-phosphate aldolase
MNDWAGPYSSDISSIQTAASELISRSWAESFFGNISILLKRRDFCDRVRESYPVEIDPSFLQGRILIVTRTLSTMKDVLNSPQEALGIYVPGKRALNLIMGKGPPTSEITSHLMAYQMGNGSVVLHCHMDSLTDASLITKDRSSLPSGIGWVDKLEPGSIQLAETTGREMQKFDMVLWKDHGPICTGKDLTHCLRRLMELDEYIKGSHP